METPSALPYEILSTYLDPRRIESAAARCIECSFPADPDIRDRVIQLMHQMREDSGTALRAYDELVTHVGIQSYRDQQAGLKVAHQRRQHESPVLT